MVPAGSGIYQVTVSVGRACMSAGAPARCGHGHSAVLWLGLHHSRGAAHLYLLGHQGESSAALTGLTWSVCLCTADLTNPQGGLNNL